MWKWQDEARFHLAWHLSNPATDSKSRDREQRQAWSESGVTVKYGQVISIYVPKAGLKDQWKFVTKFLVRKYSDTAFEK